MRPPLVALSASVLLVTAGCLGILHPAQSDPGAEAVVDEAVDAAEPVETYRVEYHHHVESIDDGDRQVVQGTTEGVVDRSARKLQVTTRQDDTNRTLYVIGNTTYTECAPPWSGWGKGEEPELDDDWTGHDPLGRQLTLLAESPVTWAGNGTLRDIAIHVVEAHPSDQTLTQFSEDRRGGITLFGPRIENASLKAWIAQDTARFLKTRLTFDIRSNEMSVESRMATTFTDYGMDAEISLPAEATEDPFELGCPGE